MESNGRFASILHFREFSEIISIHVIRRAPLSSDPTLEGRILGQVIQREWPPQTLVPTAQSQAIILAVSEDITVDSARRWELAGLHLAVYSPGNPFPVYVGVSSKVTRGSNSC